MLELAWWLITWMRVFRWEFQRTFVVRYRVAAQALPAVRLPAERFMILTKRRIRPRKGV